MTTATDHNDNSAIAGITTQRLECLADGVFAIVMTLLVIELGIPVVGSTHGAETLAAGLLHMVPEFGAYVLSFLILGIFWLIHHSIFDNIRFYDSTLVWLNIVFLALVSLVPFTTSLVGAYYTESLAALIYGGHLFGLFVMGFTLWTYATGKPELLTESVSNEAVEGARWMGVLYWSIILVGMGLAFVQPIASYCVYALIIAAFIVTTWIGRSEVVMVGKWAQE